MCACDMRYMVKKYSYLTRVGVPAEMLTHAEIALFASLTELITLSLLGDRCGLLFPTMLPVIVPAFKNVRVVPPFSCVAAMLRLTLLGNWAAEDCRDDCMSGVSILSCALQPMLPLGRKGDEADNVPAEPVALLSTVEVVSLVAMGACILFVSCEQLPAFFGSIISLRCSSGTGVVAKYAGSTKRLISRGETALVVVVLVLLLLLVPFLPLLLLAVVLLLLLPLETCCSAIGGVAAT